MTEILTRTPAVDLGVDLGVDEIAQPLRCTRIDDITHDVRSFTFSLPRPLRFDAGQYLTLVVDVDGQTLERCYTISSPPTRPDAVTITVKRVPGGPVSNWLHDNLGVDDWVDVRGPLGVFSTANHAAPRYLFLSAGSGITPLMSMTRAMYDRGDRSDVVFLHNARTPVDIVFRDELETLAREAFLSVTAICEGDASTELWNGPRGRLDLPLLLRLVPDLHEREVFTCGPPPYMEAVRELLRTAGVDPERCHEESFTIAESPTPAAQTAAGSATGHTIELRRSGRTVTCDGGSTILDAVSGAGVVVPTSCGEGVCGTCKQSMLEGEVDMQHAGGIRPREIADGKILLCCSKPLSDLVIDV
ncbi:hybrid-cluster NAD(P)-dependent oxidoreductase [Nocardioidaceae bacterium SCSIO 66511]|nr:hybrid-cluster NAD(P)-dependent oxidoreductase [Nocardioidaceae bacterium SCSIO 66511]